MRQFPTPNPPRRDYPRWVSIAAGLIVLCLLALSVAVIVVAVHFLAKVW